MDLTPDHDAAMRRHDALHLAAERAQGDADVLYHRSVEREEWEEKQAQYRAALAIADAARDEWLRFCDGPAGPLLDDVVREQGVEPGGEEIPNGGGRCRWPL